MNNAEEEEQMRISMRRSNCGGGRRMRAGKEEVK